MDRVDSAPPLASSTAVLTFAAALSDDRTRGVEGDRNAAVARSMRYALNSSQDGMGCEYTDPSDSARSARPSAR